MSEYILVGEELYHYGVPGMKWGVRRDSRLLASHRRNVAVREARDKYRSGKITKATYKKRKAAANQQRNKDMADVENQFTKAKSESARQKLERDISKRTLKEVPHANLKRGMAAVNDAMGAYSMAQVSLLTAALLPASGGAAVVAGAVGIAAEAGYRAVIRMGLDKLS